MAGGMGTRLRDVIQDVPKPMAPIQGKPFLEYLLNWVLKYPVSKIVFAVGYKADVIKAHFGENFKSIPIVYAEEKEPLGTGGAILNALRYTSNKNVIIINGDTYFPVDLINLVKFHQTSVGALSIALKEMKDFDRYGTVDLVEETITGFKEKRPLETGLINGGIYVLNRAFLYQMNLPERFSFEQAVLEEGASTGKLKAMIFTETFIDIGVPDDYKKACSEL